ncbi:hypothetical protein Tco_1200696 [Tanacetum coccineum]
MKDEAGSNLNDEENDFMINNSFRDETLEELTVVVIMMARIQPADENGQSIQTIHMLGKTPNQVYDPFLKAGLGYKNPERLKKAIAAQPKMYHGEKLYSTKLKIDSPDSEETLEDAEEKSSVDQTYFSIPPTSNICSESNEVRMDSQIPKMPKESKLLKMVEKMALAINALRDRIDVTLLEDRKRRWMSYSQNSLREFYKTDVIPMSVSLSKTLKELKQKLMEEKNELLENEIEKISSDSKDIQANLLKRIKILENDFKRSQAQSIDFELKLQHQKEKMACYVSWKSMLSKLNDENVSSNVRIDPNKRETKNLNECQSNTSVLNTKTISAVNDDSRVKRALFTSPVVAKSRNLGATSVVGKSRFSIAKTPTATNKVIQLVLWIVNSGCSKHMTGNLQLLRNFVEKFMGTVRFRNDHFVAITGYGDYVQGNLTICHVYYVEGL